MENKEESDHFLETLQDLVEEMLEIQAIPPVKRPLGVLSHHLKCEMKSPHLVDFS